MPCPVHLAEHLIASRPRVSVSCIWREVTPRAIEIARAKYDEGRVEMCQHTDATHAYLFAIPRKQPVPRPEFMKFYPATTLNGMLA